MMKTIPYIYEIICYNKLSEQYDDTYVSMKALIDEKSQKRMILLQYSAMIKW